MAISTIATTTGSDIEWVVGISVLILLLVAGPAWSIVRWLVRNWK